ncbi:MAG: Ig-like domain-containing protein [Bacteroidaceae bacterium]|nr:Ig-like domain-containing protein [Bacteroidaceae bacterium]
MKNYSQLRYLPVVLLLAVLASILFSCANMSRPSGGPRDKTPPVFVKSNPLPDSRNFTKNKLEIEFDEIIQIDKPSEKVIISPPQINMPKIQAQGKKVRVELQDSLLPNTTYTIDFSNSIVDNNERNPLDGFSFSFSTGESRDSLQISGILLNAADLEPITGMLVGVYTNLDDTAFKTLPMERITASDALGHFTIRNLKPGNYRIVALKDMNRNYRFDNPTEDIAFGDSTLSPYAVPQQYIDTIFTDSATVDTIIHIDYNKFYPNNILLMAFNEQKPSRYLDSNTRKERRKLEYIFAAPHDSVPVVTPLNFDAKDNWYVLEKNHTNDTLYYWIKDSLVYNIDTLKVAMQYYRTDTLNELSLYDDTLTMVYRAPKEKSKKSKKRAKNDSLPEVVPTVFAKMDVSISGKMDVNKPISITFETPIDSIDLSAFHLYEKRDTVWNSLPDTAYSITQDTLSIRRYLLKHKWKPEGAYRLEADSMAVVDMYGLHTDKFKRDFTIKSLQEYSNLYFAISGVSDSAIVVLLNSSDKPVMSAPVKDGGAEFTYVKPGTYYARLFIDSNHNDKYDTGNYDLKQQPEEVYYYPHELELRAYWNVEQEWNIYNTAIDKQKPLAIKKNKPKEEKPVKEENEDDEHQNEHNDSYYQNSGYPQNYGGAPTLGGNPRPINNF